MAKTGGTGASPRVHGSGGSSDLQVLPGVSEAGGEEAAGHCLTRWGEGVVAILNATPGWCRGVQAALEDVGFSVETPGDVSAWFTWRRRGVAVICLDERFSVADLGRIRAEHRDALVVALLPRSCPVDSREAMLAGASAVASQDAELYVIVGMVVGVTMGLAVLPRDTARSMIESMPAPVRPPQVSPVEREWLAAIAGGRTVADLAEQSSYSERVVYRRLASLYQRLGASSRTEALLAAVRHGLIE